jgi:rhodanese-related sulfurtransferase
MAFMTAAKLSCDDSLSQLVDKAAQRRASGLYYSGEVSPQESFDYISKNPSIIIDVRTGPEWQFVGIPDLSDTPSRLVTISWKLYPSFVMNPRFIGDLIAETSIAKDTPLFFICRSGGRSLDAAVAVAAEGYYYCFNITGGFEGDVNSNRQRSMEHGWKHDNLPWVQG